MLRFQANGFEPRHPKRGNQTSRLKMSTALIFFSQIVLIFDKAAKGVQNVTLHNTILDFVVFYFNIRTCRGKTRKNGPPWPFANNCRKTQLIYAKHAVPGTLLLI